MCLAIEQMREESVKKGIKEEQERGILKMVKGLKEASIPFELCFSIVANAYTEVEAISIQKTIDQVYSS